MTKLDIAKKEGRERFEKKFTTNRNGHIGSPENEIWPHIITKSASRDMWSLFSSHERAIEIALLEDLVEEAKVMKVKETHSENYESYVAFNSALTTLITKYQDRINKLKA